MSEIIVYASDSAYQNGKDNTVVRNSFLEEGKYKLQNNAYATAHPAIIFPTDAISTINSSKLNSFTIQFFAASSIRYRLGVFTLSKRPNLSTITMQQLYDLVIYNIDLAGYIPPGGKQDDLLSLTITDVDAAIKILKYGISVQLQSEEGWSSVPVDYRCSFYSTRAFNSNFYPRIIINYSDNNTPPVAEIISPKNTMMDGSKSITLKWRYAQAVNMPQSNYDIQYSVNNGQSWTTLANKTASSTMSYTVNPNTFPSGILQWRVRVWSKGSVSSQWDTTTIIIRAAPPTPSIYSVETTPRPLIQWKSTDQNAYQLKAGTYDSGIVFGTEKQKKIPLFLPDGTTLIQLRVENNVGLWSPWASFSVYTQNIPNGTNNQINLFTRPFNAGTKLKWNIVGSFKEFYVYRDGKPIAKTDGSIDYYIDYQNSQKAMYQIRGVLPQNDYYVMSNQIIDTPQVDGAVLSDISFINWIALKVRRSEIPIREKSASRSVAYFHYDGRHLPVAQVSEYVDRSHTYQYTLVEEDTQRLEALLGKIVIVKDNYGRKSIGVLDSIEFDEKRRVDVNFSITDVDYREFIDNEI